MVSLRHPGLVPGSTDVSGLRPNKEAEDVELSWMPAQGRHDGEAVCWPFP